MLIEPKTRGFICTTAHPVGCEINVRRQVSYVKEHPKVAGPKKVLVIGASAGYGLASRIEAAFGCGAATIGVIFDKPASGKRTATAGWYNTAAFEKCAAEEGIYAKTVNGDAFSREVKDEVIGLIKTDLGQVDMVVYSLAAPRRAMADGTVYSSVLKTTGAPYTNKTIDLKSRQVEEVTIEPASDEEIAHTVKVMGGEDWMDWMDALHDAGVLAEKAVTVAYSYIGPELTHPMYYDGSIGAAKQHLYETARRITEKFDGVQGYVSVNKALVTQSSAAIPIVPLYITVLYRIMKKAGTHEGCIEQMERLFREKLFGGGPVLDERGLIRMDDLEMKEEIQSQVAAEWEQVESSTVEELCDIDGYWEDFYQMFGFRLPGVDYAADVDPDVPIPSIGE
ncbi:enoyl-ACP reductase FabV [Zongyangia hominis]|uniref:Trans-2-enoyl-CoA reductase [NADH] n=1 Tax=Zongyangia hominis TaxID=2763677 RepID=A0A926EEQ0_9FIRM|nr:enoyl-ACP reductase FabV [Zongyangia hominis]MBC8570357.1 trans-2-enoyl-CoA reductase family protein [Zongyangia hominis]